MLSLRLVCVVAVSGSVCFGQVGPGTIESMEEVVLRQRALDRALDREKTRTADVRRKQRGEWMIPAHRVQPRSHSRPHSVINHGGDTRMAIGFGRRVDFEGAWFAGQGGRGAWTSGVRIVAFRDGKEVARTDWFERIGRDPAWLAAGLEDVDRIEIRCRGVIEGRGWYALDDLTYRLHGDEKQRVVDFDDLTHRRVLTGSGYAGLTWEVGAGAFPQAKSRGGIDAVPPPRTFPADRGTATQGNTTIERGPRTGSATTSAHAPNLVQQFDGPRLGDPGGGAVPPDTCGACGLDHFVAIVNKNLSVYRKRDGFRVVNVGLPAFWGRNGGGDPRVVFDPHSRRFFLSGMDGPTGNLYFAMSLTSDPTGKWFKTWWAAGVGSDKGKWPDFPTLGVDKRGVYIAALMVGRSTITVWAIEKAPLLQATPKMGTVTAWRGLYWEGAIQPCVTHGDDGGAYLVSRAAVTLLRVRRVVWNKSTPSLLEMGMVKVPYHVRAPGAPNRGGKVNLATGDFRPSFAVYRNGSIWLAQTVDVSGRAAVRWYEIDAKKLVTTQVGTVSDPVRHYFYPSITVNAQGDVAMGFSGAHAGEYAGGWFTGRLATDPKNTMGTPRQLVAGAGPYNIVTNNGVVRWGDYSATFADPRDRTIWTIQEYSARTSGNQWGTRIGRLDFDWFGYGVGWKGTNGIPDLHLTGQPYLGKTPLLRIGNSRGAFTTGWLVIGGGPVNVPLLDGTLLVQPTVVKGLAIPFFGLGIPAPIPNDPTLRNQAFFMQVLQVDPGASQGVAFSRGVEVRIGP